MRILICIDDTDNLESIGTGEVLENMCAELERRGLGRGGFVTRHQLLIHEDIPYTSHNSSMCCQAEVGDLEEAVAFCREYMDRSCAQGSDPGLCIVDLDRLENEQGLISFGFSAKNFVLKKQDAIDEAALYPASVRLSEHGGTGGGVIGALAGCGLRLSGSDGKIKGKLLPPGSGKVTMTVAELCRFCRVSLAVDTEKKPIADTDTVFFDQPTKAVFLNGEPAIYLKNDDSGNADWRVFGKKELKGMVS